MEWQKETDNGMGKGLFFKLQPFFLVILILNNSLIQAQDIDKKSRGFAFGGETLALIPYDGSINSIYETDYEVDADSFIWGVSLFTHYHFSHNIYASLALGYETLNQPNINYYPFTIGGGLLTSSGNNGFLLEANFGTHLGDLESSGFIFRGKIGYSVGFLYNKSLNFGLLYSYQNLNKTFENSMRPENYYNMESLGIFINIKWNRYEK